MRKIYFATSNKGKLEEVQEFLGIPLESVNIEVDEVQSMDLEYVVTKKVEAAYKKVKKPVIVDDVGAYFDAWDGFPGPFIKYMFKHVGNPGIIKLIGASKSRKLTMRSAVGFHDGKKIHTFIGEIRCTVAPQVIGKDGWGLDPILIPQGKKETFAEMGMEGKNKISHRRRAFDKFKEFLGSKEGLEKL